MSRDNPGEELTKVHLYLDKEDLEWYKTMYGERIGLSKSIRVVMRDYRKRVEAQAQQHHKSVAPKAQLPEDLSPSLEGGKDESGE